MSAAIPLIRGFALLPTLHWLAQEGVPVERALAEADLSIVRLPSPSARYRLRTWPLCSEMPRGNTVPTFPAESFADQQP